MCVYKEYIQLYTQTHFVCKVLVIFVHCSVLTHLPLVLHLCVSESNQQWFTQWLVAYSAPSHYLNQCWVIVNWTIRNKLRWNLNRNTKLFIHENALENVVWKMVVILSRDECVNQTNCRTQAVELRQCHLDYAYEGLEVDTCFVTDLFRQQH